MHNLLFFAGGFLGSAAVAAILALFDAREICERGEMNGDLVGEAVAHAMHVRAQFQNGPIRRVHLCSGCFSLGGPFQFGTVRRALTDRGWMVLRSAEFERPSQSFLRRCPPFWELELDLSSAPAHSRPDVPPRRATVVQRIAERFRKSDSPKQ